MTGIVNSTGARSGIIGTTVGSPSPTNAADIGAGVLPVGVTGGSGLTALGTVASGVIGASVTGGAGLSVTTLGTFAGMSYNAAAGPCTGNAIGMAASATYTAIIGAAYSTINHIVMGYTITTNSSSVPTVTKLWNHSGNLILDITGTTVFVNSLHAVFPQPWALIWRTG